MDVNDFVGLSFKNRIREMKLWPFMVGIAIVFGVFGIYKVIKSVDPIVGQIYAISATLHVTEKKLAEIESKIDAFPNQDSIPQSLIKEKLKQVNFKEELENKLEDLYKKAEKKGISFNGPEYSSISYPFIGSAHAKSSIDDLKEHDKIVSIDDQQVFRKMVLKIILIILAIVYLLINYKVWFSSNPRNMNVAIDLLKTLTGFWVGLGTTAF